MIRALVNRMLDSAERDLGVPVDEGRYMAEHSLSAVLAVSNVRKVSEFRKYLPDDVHYVAKIAAYRQEDCGSCLQISVNKAKRAGVSPAIIQAAIDGRLDLLRPELRLVYRFAEKQANREDDPDARAQIIRLYGHKGLIELALAISTTRLYPAMKRVLGYATSCSRIKIAV